MNLDQLTKRYLLSISVIMVMAPFFSVVIKGLANIRNWQILAALLIFASYKWVSEWPAVDEKRLWRLFLAAALWALIANGFLHYYNLNLWEDFALFDTMLYNSHSGSFTYSPICECNHIAMHTSYTMLLLIPIHALFSSPAIIILAHAFAIWLSFFPLKKLTEFHHWNFSHTSLLLICFITFAWTGQVANTGFHFEVFYIPTFLWFLYGWETKQLKIWLSSAVVALLTKEDAPIYLIPFGAASLLIDSDKRRSLALITASALFMGLNVGVLQPYYKTLSDMGNPFYNHFWRDYGESMPQVAMGILTSPMQVLYDVLSSKWYMFFGATLFVPFLSFRALAVFLPSIVLFGTATHNPLMQGFGSYYVSPLLPFLFFGLIEGTNKLKRNKAMSRWCLIPLFVAPFVSGGYLRFPKPQLEKYAELKTIIEKNTTTKEVCVQNGLMTYLPYHWPLRKISETCLDQQPALFIAHPELTPYPYTAETLKKLIDENSTEVNRSKTGFLYKLSTK